MSHHMATIAAAEQAQQLQAQACHTGFCTLVTGGIWGLSLPKRQTWPLLTTCTLYPSQRLCYAIWAQSTYLQASLKLNPGHVSFSLALL